MKLGTMNGKRRFKKALKNTGQRNHKKILCLEKDTDRNFMVNEIRSATDFSSVNIKRDFVSLTLGYYAYLRQKKEGKTDKTYEEWYKTYIPYKR